MDFSKYFSEGENFTIKSSNGFITKNNAKTIGSVLMAAGIAGLLMVPGGAAQSHPADGHLKVVSDAAYTQIQNDIVQTIQEATPDDLGKVIVLDKEFRDKIVEIEGQYSEVDQQVEKINEFLKQNLDDKENNLTIKIDPEKDDTYKDQAINYVFDYENDANKHIACIVSPLDQKESAQDYTNKIMGEGLDIFPNKLSELNYQTFIGMHEAAHCIQYKEGLDLPDHNDFETYADIIGSLYALKNGATNQELQSFADIRLLSIAGASIQYKMNKDMSYLTHYGIDKVNFEISEEFPEDLEMLKSFSNQHMKKLGFNLLEKSASYMPNQTLNEDIALEVAGDAAIDSGYLTSVSLRDMPQIYKATGLEVGEDIAERLEDAIQRQYQNADCYLGETTIQIDHQDIELFSLKCKNFETGEYEFKSPESLGLKVSDDNVAFVTLKNQMITEKMTSEGLDKYSDEPFENIIQSKDGNYHVYADSLSQETINKLDQNSKKIDLYEMTAAKTPQTTVVEFQKSLKNLIDKQVEKDNGIHLTSKAASSYLDDISVNQRLTKEQAQKTITKVSDVIETQAIKYNTPEIIEGINFIKQNAHRVLEPMLDKTKKYEQEER